MRAFAMRHPWEAHDMAVRSVSRSNMCRYYSRVGWIRNVPAPEDLDEQQEEMVIAAAVVAAEHILQRKRTRHAAGM